MYSLPYCIDDFDLDIIMYIFIYGQSWAGVPQMTSLRTGAEANYQNSGTSQSSGSWGFPVPSGLLGYYFFKSSIFWVFL